MEEKIRVIGYMSLYMAIYKKTEPKKRFYLNINCDFKKALKEEVFEKLLNTARLEIAKANNINPEQITGEFVTKEEFEDAARNDAYDTHIHKF